MRGGLTAGMFLAEIGAAPSGHPNRTVYRAMRIRSGREAVVLLPADTTD
jgi:hypothetical protein